MSSLVQAAAFTRHNICFSTYLTSATMMNTVTLVDTWAVYLFICTSIGRLTAYMVVM